MRRTRKPVEKKSDKPERRVIKPYDPTGPVKAYMTRNPSVVSSETGAKTGFWILQTKSFKQLLVMDRGNW